MSSVRQAADPRHALRDQPSPQAADSAASGAAGALRIVNALSGAPTEAQWAETLLALALEYLGPPRQCKVQLLQLRDEALAVTNAARVDNGKLQRLSADSVQAAISRSDLNESGGATQIACRNNGRALPIMCNARLAGVLYCETITEDAAMLDARLAWLELIAAQAGVALQQLQDKQRLADADRACETLRSKLQIDDQLLGSLVESMPDRVYAKDTGGRFLFANRAAACSLGVATPADAIGKTDHDFFPPDAAERFAAEERAILDSRIPVQEREERHVDANGAVRWIAEMKLPMHAPDGRIIGIVGIGRDITQRKLSEEMARNLNTELEARVAERTRQISDANRALESEAAGRRRLEADLALERDLLRTIIDNMPDQIFVKDAQCRFMIANPATEKTIGLPITELIGKSDLDLYPADTARSFFDDEQDLIRSGQPVIDKVESNANKFGVQRWFSTTKVPFFKDGQVAGIVGIARDITRRQQAEEKLVLRDRAIESCVNAVFITTFRDRQHQFDYVNPAFERITGYSPADVLGRDISCLLPQERSESAIQQIVDAYREHREGHAVVRSARKDGRLVWIEIHIAPVRDDNANLTHFVGIMNDITQAREYEEQLAQLASFDVLTGLPNRRMLLERLNYVLATAERERRTVAVVFFDLDRFKSVNDTLGHDAGDLLLKTIAQRVNGNVRRGDIVARISGDEFVLVLPEGIAPYRPNDGGTGHAGNAHAGNAHVDEMTALEVINRVQQHAIEPVMIGNQEIVVTCSMGVSFFPHDGQDAETLLKHADTAMYQAKENGRNRIYLYTEELNRRMTEQFTLERLLRRALDRHEFSLAYQPKIDLRTGQVAGVEALLRWNSAEKGSVPPIVFIPLLERTGLINRVGAWVIEQALRDQAAWKAAGLPSCRIAVNVSQVQLEQRNFVDSIKAILGNCNCDDTCIDVEMTESLIMQNVEATVSKLHAIRQLGIGIGVDDFGTGYSSLSYLVSMPANALKIDRSFISNMLATENDLNIVSTIISLAHSLKLKVVAEGVETVEQMVALERLDCDEIQGYYISRPLPLRDYIAWQQRYNASLPAS